MSTVLPIKRAHLAPQPASNSFDLYLQAPDELLPPSALTSSTPTTRRRAMLCPMVPPAINATDDGAFALPTATLTHEGAQALIDALWQAGLRPTKSLKSSEPDESAATQRAVITDLTRQLVQAKNQHIEDLRVIAQITKPRDRPATSGDSAEPLF